MNEEKATPEIDPLIDREQALDRAGLADGPDPSLDRLTSLVCAGLHVPVSLISLVNRDAQHFVSAHGLDASWASTNATPVSDSLSRHVVASEQPLIVSDTRHDARVCDDAAVRDLKVVAYIGMPLRSPRGQVLGTLCAIDHEPREWSVAERDVLARLAAIFTDHLLLRERTGELEQTARTLRRREVDLREREARLQSALAAASMGTWDWDLVDGTIRIDTRQAQLMGLPAGTEVIPEDDYFSRIHPDDLDALTHGIQGALSGESAVEATCRIRRPDGSVRSVLLRGQVFRAPDGRATRVLGINLDVSDRMAAMEALRERDERIRALLDSTGEGIYGLDLDGRCTFANLASAAMLGCDSPGDLLGRNMHETMHHHRADGNPYPESECRIYRAFREGRGVHVDDEVLFRRDGTSFPAEYWSYPVFRDGERVGAVVTFLDISERLEASRRLVESEEFLHFTIDALTTHIAILDERGRIIRTNRAWDEFAARNGGTPEACGRGASYLEACAHEEGDGDADEVGRVVQDMLEGRREHFELEYACHAPGQEHWFLLRLNRFRTPLGTRVVAAHDDISSRKSAEVRARRRAEMLSRLNEVNRGVAATLDLDVLVQQVTDVATELTGASFGAFFYNATGADDDAYMLYTIAGVPRAAFEQLPMPRATGIFAPTFQDGRVLRLDDVLADERYGHNEPYTGMPSGHLAVRSYLAVPVISRRGEVIGALLFGHPAPGVFSEEAESIAVGIAAQAAVAIDNARLFADARTRAREYSAMFENAAVGIANTDTTGRVLLANDRLGEITGQPSSAFVGRSIFDLIHPDDRELARARFDEVIQAASAKSLVELRIQGPGGRTVWVQQAASLIARDEPEPAKIVLIVQDITARKSAEEHQNMLVRELSHRVKNLLASVSSIAAQTLRQSDTLDAFSEAFQGRIAALASVHGLLVRTDWRGCSLRSVLEKTFSPYGEASADGVRLDGVDVFLSPRSALALSLVFHELATNAVKYGPLAHPGGRIEVVWRVTPGADGVLDLSWSESGGPPVTPPETPGFGTTLITRGIEYELDGEATLDYRPSGLVCRLRTPRKSIVTLAPAGDLRG